MKVRRYREGRLVLARRWRQATLESARNLVLLKLGGMLADMDRFTLMLDALRAWAPVEATELASKAKPARCSAAIAGKAVDPDTHEVTASGMLAVQLKGQAGNRHRVAVAKPDAKEFK